MKAAYRAPLGRLTTHMQFIVEFFTNGGIWMWVILAVGVLAAAIFLERFFVLFGKANVDKDKFIAHVQRAILAGDLNSAINYCNERSTPLSNIVKSGIISVMNKGRDEEIQTSMDVAALREIPKVEKRTSYLPLLANVATLLGLLSTIVGLIMAFESVAGTDPSKKAAVLARGISIAMNGTAFGLIVAIPTLLGSALLMSKTQSILDDVHEVSVATLNLILQNRDKFPAR
jgi:biopolymer transport protein ExbB